MNTQHTAAVDQEIAQEQAEALGHAGRQLEAALIELREYDAAVDPTGTARDRLVARAAQRAQNVLIQRESRGLRDPHYVFRFYSVPPEVVARIGVRAR